MKVLGIDPGTATTGWAVVEFIDNSLVLHGYGAIITPKGTDLASRLEAIYVEINEIINRFEPTHSAIEILYFSKNVKTGISVSHARGVLLLALRQNNIEITEFTPNQIKLAITGYGKATKKQVQAAVKTLTGLSKIPKPDDAADAIGIAICKILTTGNINVNKF